MTRSVFATVLGSVLALVPSAAHAAGPIQRYALVVGANSGGAGRPQLQYAISDAERFARVMVDLGGVAPSNEIVLRQPKLKDLIDALDTLTRRVNEARRTAGAAGGRTEVILYYSGHADEQGLLVGDDRYSYRTLRDRLDQIPADVRIAVLDACSSGAFTRMKGGRARAPFMVDESANMRGHAFLTSSAASEAAQESDLERHRHARDSWRPRRRRRRRACRAIVFDRPQRRIQRDAELLGTARPPQELQRRAGLDRGRLAVRKGSRVTRPNHETDRLIVDAVLGARRNSVRSAIMARSCSGVLMVVLGVGLFAAEASAQPARSVFVTTPDGAKIHCLDAGRGPAPAVLLVPGWTMPAEIWEPQLTFLQTMYRVVAMDPRGQGRSSAASDGLYPAARARDIKAVVDDLKLAPLVLVGWSMAVNEVAAYVDQFGTDTLAGLMLVDGGAGQDFDLTIMPRTLRGFIEWLARDRREAADQFVRSLFKRPQSDEYLQHLIDASLRTPANSAFTLGTASVLTDNRPALAKIDRPTLIVAAAGPLIEAFRDMQRRIRGSRLVVVQDVGHALFVDDADQFNTLLEQFLRSVQ